MMEMLLVATDVQLHVLLNQDIVAWDNQVNVTYLQIVVLLTVHHCFTMAILPAFVNKMLVAQEEEHMN